MDKCAECKASINLLGFPFYHPLCWKCYEDGVEIPKDYSRTSKAWMTSF